MPPTMMAIHSGRSGDAIAVILNRDKTMAANAIPVMMSCHDFLNIQFLVFFFARVSQVDMTESGFNERLVMPSHNLLI